MWVRRAVGVVGLLAWLGLLAGPAVAAGPRWLPAQVIEQNQGSIDGLSCPSATTCLAASSNPVVQDGGPSFERDPDPSSLLDAVSCAPATRFCMFVDTNGGAFAYTNGTFGSVADIDGDVEIDGVACPSSSLCMAIDHNNTVFKYSSGSWDGGTPLAVPTGDTPSNFVNVACATTTFCVALVGTDNGELYYTWTGSSWSSASSPFDATAGHVVSLSCTSTSFCLATDDIGQALVFNGTSWSSPNHIDTFNPQPILYSACVGTSCVAVDFFDNFFQSTDGSTWSSAVNIHSSTSISGVESLACATATLCVAGDGVGDATTYAIPPTPGKPTLTGTPSVGHALTLGHAPVQTQPVWRADDWRRCASPDAGCTLSPISRSQTGYTLATADANRYIDVRETVGFGFDEEGPLVSNIVGPIVPTPGTASFAGSVTTTRAGVVTVALRCTGGPCKGAVKLSYHGSSVGSAVYSIASGQTGKIKIRLTRSATNQLQQRGQLTVTLVIKPSQGRSTGTAIKLKTH